MSCLSANLDEEDDLSEGDVSADPAEGKQTLFFILSTIRLMSVSEAAKGEKRKRDENGVEDNKSPPRKI